jgi:hypothetical protein
MTDHASALPPSGELSNPPEGSGGKPPATMAEIATIHSMTEWEAYVDTHDLSEVWDQLEEPPPEPTDQTVCPKCGAYVVNEWHAELHLGVEEA